MIINKIKRKIRHILLKWNFLPSRLLTEPGGKEKLDKEYKSGIWDYLTGVEELSRFSVIAGYCKYFKPDADIIEIGCGEGLLMQRLCKNSFHSFIGIDISEEAIKRANQQKKEKSEFIATDAMLFNPQKKYDIVIFNECTIYFEDPAKLILKYLGHIKQDGLIVVSIFREGIRSDKIWKKILFHLNTVTETTVMNSQNLIWDIKVCMPKLTEIY